jgi:hypothetical protein
MKDLFDSEQDENPQNYYFGHRDDILYVSGQCCTAHVDKNENHSNRHRHDQCRSPVPGDIKNKAGYGRKIVLNEFPEITCETKSI